MAMAPVYLGVTPPVSLASAGPQDRANSDVLAAFLDKVAPQATHAERELRREIISELEQLVRAWVVDVAELNDWQVSSEAAPYLALLIPFGSYSLGLVESGSDVDAVVVTPAFVTKEDFFGSLVYRIAELGSGVVKDLSVVREASTPVVKFIMRGVDVDLLFCNLPTCPALLSPDTLHEVLNEDSLLPSLTDASARALNGPRVAHDIRRLTPATQTENFLLLLRAVKFWAKSRAVYSNAMGYFGGVTWAIMVARVCQLFPNMAASQLLVRFFKVYALWDWTHPVQLVAVAKKFEAPHLRVWTPNGLRPDLMPIITPSFPAMNSGYNVSQTTKTVLLEELQRAHAFCGNLKNFDTDFDSLGTLMHAVSKDDFPLLLEVQASAERSALLQKLCGFVESRVRSLMAAAERTAPNLKLRPLHAFKEDERSGQRPCSAFFIGLTLQTPGDEAERAKPSKPQDVDLRSAVASWMEKLLEWSDAKTVRDFFDVTVRAISAPSPGGDRKRRRLE